MRHFDYGGAFDAVGEAAGANVTKALKFLASKLSKEDWAKFQLALSGERKDDDDARDTDPPDLMEVMSDPDHDFGGPAMDSALRRRPRNSFERMFPDAAQVRHV